MVLRGAREDEVETLVAIQAEAEGARVVVAEHVSGPVGVAGIRFEWLDALYVVPACWGAGVAPALHDGALEEVAALGATRCHLWVLEANARARRYYERRGWRENGTERVVPFGPKPIDVGYTRNVAPVPNV